MIAFSIPLADLQLFLLIFFRISAIILFTPPLDNRHLPFMVKIGLSLSFSFIIFHIFPHEIKEPITEILSFFLVAIGEVAVGAVIGFSVKILFAGVLLAGEVVGNQMGFSLARQVDPQLDVDTSAIGQFKNLIAILVFFASNGHHVFFRALAESFRLVPPFDFRFGASLTHALVTLTSDMFLIAVKVGAPLIASLLLTSVTLALAARAVPQMNIFIVAFPIKIMVGLFFLMLSIPFLCCLLRDLFHGLEGTLFVLLKAM